MYNLRISYLSDKEPVTYEMLSWEELQAILEVTDKADVEYCLLVQVEAPKE